MKFPPEFLDEIRARLPVSEVVGRRVKLKKQGREWRGLSPFNKEKTPSFYVNDQKGFFKDFSSGKSGDQFTFVMETEGVTFPEAVERLAGEAGVPMPVFSREAQAQDHKRKTLHDVLELAAKFYEATLAGRAGAKARGYLADRSLEPAAQVKFRMGYATAERFALKEHLGGHGVSVPDMIEAGLLIAGEDIPVPYDRFRDRVMFPITDVRNRVVAFGGRALDPDAPAKYLNSNETALFHKGGTLYNLPAARAASHRGAPVVVVEGYVDVIALVMAGYEAAVAPLGTALTEDQVALLWKMTDEPVLCFDGDGAGRRAAYRAVDVALPKLTPGKSLRFATLPDGQDPDDLARSGGRGAIAEVLDGARPLAEVLWNRELAAGPADTPERRAALEKRLHDITGQIAEETVRKHYRADMASRLRTLFAPQDTGRRQNSSQGARQGFGGQQGFAGQQGFGGQQSFNRGGGNARGRGGSGYAARPMPLIASPQLAASPMLRGYRSQVQGREALILQAVLNHPWLLHDHLEDFAQLEFRHPDASRLKGVMIDIFAHQPAADRAIMATEITKRGHDALVARVEHAITTPSVWGAQPDAAPDDVLHTWNQLVALHHRWHSLLRELKDAELALGQDNTEANNSWLNDVKARLSQIDGTEALIEGFGASSGRPARTL